MDILKVYALSKLEIFNLFLHNIVKWLGNLRKTLIPSNYVWKVPILSQLYISCDFLVPDKPTNDMKTLFFWKINCSLSWWWWNVSSGFTKFFFSNNWFVTSFWKMSSQKSIKDSQQNERKTLRQKDSQRSVRKLSQTRPWFSFLIVVFKIVSAEARIIFFIGHLVYGRGYSILNLGEKIESFWKIYSRRYWHYNSYYKINNSNAALSTDQATSPCSSHSEVCSCVRMGNSSKFTCIHLL